MIDVLVVDDDYCVADINAAYDAKVDGFRVVGQAHNAAEASESVRRLRPALVLLDLYLPDDHGLALMRRLRELPGRHADVVVITAARDVDSVRTAMQLGAVFYLVKPFGFSRLAERLTGYRQLQDSIGQLEEASQEDVDKLYGLLRTPPAPQLPKGQSGTTMTRIVDVLRSAPEDLTAAAIAGQLGLSRPTAQRYLAQLVRSGVVDLDLRYGAAGRPSHRYRLHR